MLTIWKFPIPRSALRSDRTFSLEMPHNARVLSVQLQFDHPYLWALVDCEIPRVHFHFEIFATGDDLGEVAGKEYIGTFLEGHYAWHVFRQVS